MRRTVLLVTFVFVCLTGIAPPAGAWGEEGHRWINLVAAQKLPQDMPGFFRGAGARLSYLGPEPDRWRDNRELFGALREVNAPDHFIDIDKPQNFEAIPNDRYKYGDWLRAQGKVPNDIGFLPYSILESYGKVQVLFRLWRDPQQASNREQIEQNIVYCAGILGHYVADGSQPLHATIHFNGWTTSSNPDLYSREPLHGRFEGEYVKSQLKPEDIGPLVMPATRLADPFSDTMKYLLDSYNQVPELYRLEKVARWDGNNSNGESKRFALARLAAGSQMLANLWYTAWLTSGN